MFTRSNRRLVAALCSTVLVLGACSSDDEPTEDDTEVDGGVSNGDFDEDDFYEGEFEGEFDDDTVDDDTELFDGDEGDEEPGDG